MRRETDPSKALSKLQLLTRALLDDIQIFDALELIHSEFSGLLPFERTGYAEVNTETDRVTARWAKSDGRIVLRTGFSAPLKGSSLSIVLDQKKPRILNDLPAYLEHRPESKSTRLIVKEGFRSSLTVPVFLGDNPIGFVFFSSRELGAFTDVHIGLSNELSLLLAMVHKNSEPKPTTRDELSNVGLESVKGQPSSSRPVVMQSDEPDSSTDEAYLSQLRPGMELTQPVKHADGKLLLASGSVLTVQAIDKLTDLRIRGLLDHQIYKVARHSKAL